MAEEPAPTQGQDPAQQIQQTPVAQAPPPAAPAPVQPAAGAGPWDQDLRQSFTDPAIQAQVDNFLRSRVQPRMTQLEQQVAQASEAQALYTALNEDPQNTYIEISRAVYGDEYANALQAQVAAEQQAPQQQYEQVQTQQAQGLDPRVEAMVNDYETQQQQAAYDAAKAEFLTNPAYADIKSDLFDPFVGAAETWEQAADMYRSWAANAAQAVAPTPPATQETAPPVMGNQGGGTSEQPVQQKQSLHEAIDDWASTRGQNDTAPPVLG